MKIWTIFWAYWKWFCTALVTSTVILLLVATAINALKPVKVDQQKLINECLDKGGAWDSDAGACKSSA